MKNFKIKTLAMIAFFALTQLSVNADLIEKSDFVRIDNIGMNLIKSNNINKRFVFNFTNIGQQGAYPALIDTSYSNDLNLHNNRTISVYIADYAKSTSNDEVAALIAHDLAQGVHSYTGVLNGQFMFTKNGVCPFNYIAKKNEMNFDKTSVDYLVKAGYNPVAIITMLDKTGAEWRGTFCGRHNKTNKRIQAVYEYIKARYPQYLKSNSFTTSAHYKNVIK